MSLVQLKTELRQELKLTPQLMQSMEVLQMTSQELLEYLSRQAEENPLLDQSDPPERAYEELRRQAGWIDGGVRDRATFAHEEAAMEAGREDSRLESLAAFLRDQIHRLRLSKPLTALCQYLAELVDEDGYLAQEDLDGLASMRIPQALTDQALDPSRAWIPRGWGPGPCPSACCSSSAAGRARTLWPWTLPPASSRSWGGSITPPSPRSWGPRWRPSGRRRPSSPPWSPIPAGPFSPPGPRPMSGPTCLWRSWRGSGR